MTISEAIRIHFTHFFLTLSSEAASGLGSKILARPQFLCPATTAAFLLPPFHLSATTRCIRSVSSHHHFHHSSLRLSSIFTCSRAASCQKPASHHTTNSQHITQLLRYLNHQTIRLHHHRSLALSRSTGYKPRSCHQDCHLNLPSAFPAQEPAILILTFPSAKDNSTITPTTRINISTCRES